MTNFKENKYTGVVKVFNGQFGFIKSDLGDTYFHKSGIANSTKIDIGDTVEFQIEPSIKKKDSFQAFGIIIIIKNDEKANKSTPHLIGILKWFDNDKGFGIICTPERCKR